MSAINDIVLPAIVSGATGLATWFASRRKYATELDALKQEVAKAEQAVEKAKSEVSASELENVEKSVAIYRGMVEDLGMRVDALSKNINQLRVENEELVKENKALKRRIGGLVKEIQQLRDEQQNSHS